LNVLALRSNGTLSKTSDYDMLSIFDVTLHICTMFRVITHGI